MLKDREVPTDHKARREAAPQVLRVRPGQMDRKGLPAPMGHKGRRDWTVHKVLPGQMGRQGRRESQVRFRVPKDPKELTGHKGPKVVRGHRGSQVLYRVPKGPKGLKDHRERMVLKGHKVPAFQ